MEIFALLLAFQLKHYLCDYPLQGKYMLGKFKEKDWEIPLTAHAFVHFLGTFLIAIFFGFEIALGVALLDFAIHFIIDRLKVKYSKGLETNNSKFWHYLGLDQMGHHLTHYVIIFILIS